MNGLRGKTRMAEVEVFVKSLLDMDELNKSINVLRFTEHEGMKNPLLNKVRNDKSKEIAELVAKEIREWDKKRFHR